MALADARRREVAETSEIGQTNCDVGAAELVIVMGLDIYVGPLTRYYSGTWRTVVQQACECEHIDFSVEKNQPVPDKVTDTAVVAGAVREWQKLLESGLKVAVTWPEGGDLPYWTNKPGWDCWGALLLLAAYQVCPAKKPSGTMPPDALENFHDSPAVIAAREAGGGDYPSLLLGAEWWLPVDQCPKIFGAEDVGGNIRRMSRTDTLRDELERLNNATLKLDDNALAEGRKSGSPPAGASLEECAKFAFCVLFELTDKAIAEKQPLLMDY